MRITYLTIAFLLCSSVAHGAIYQQVDENGHVSYTDQPPQKDSQPITFKPITVTPAFSPSAKSGNQTTGKTTTSTRYGSLALISPTNNAVIRANNGEVTVQLSSTPSLDSAAGDRYLILVNGQEKAKSTQTEITLPSLDRGQHTLSSQIIDKQGNVIATTAPLIIHVKRHSRLHRKP